MTVVVGYVPSRTGYLAVTEALKETSIRGGDVVVVNVVPTADFTEPTAADQPDLDALAARLVEAGVEFEIRHRTVHPRSVAEEILAVAAEKDAELIVVGVHRRSPLGKAILGSTAQRVLLEAACPVLSVKPPED